ncbi:lysophospholipid acyltransferase family protein [Terriglobus sp.]|uniref:lysophospholipid acyltransferase family protein n=1 Tax=Terriglobus sp. TaxID=1889013 RepID=UPI003B00181F
MSRTGSSTHQPFTKQQQWLLRIVPGFAASLIRVLCATLHFQEVLAPGAHPADRDQSAGLYPFWHNCLLLAAYRYRNLGIHILISPSFDGELIARTVARLGFVPVRGSSSRGGAAGLLSISRALAAGHKCAITADGPRGPAFLSKPGAAAIATNAAQRRSASGSDPILVSAFYLHPHRAWRLRSWDGFLIPKPFSLVTVAWQTPLPATAPGLPQALQATLDAAKQAAIR